MDVGVPIYAVRMADGEIAEDVEGSEIRAPRSDENGGGSSEAGGYANTRSEGFSAFDQASVLGADASPQADRRELTVPQMSCRPTENGVAWEFISCEDINWSPPTESMLQAHMEAQRQREEELQHRARLRSVRRVFVGGPKLATIAATCQRGHNCIRGR